jgi:hypothetical protein
VADDGLPADVAEREHEEEHANDGRGMSERGSDG